MKFGIEMLVFNWGCVKVPPGHSKDYARAQAKRRRPGQAVQAGPPMVGVV